MVLTVTIYRKLLKNELAAKLVLGAGAAPTGAPGNGVDAVNAVGARYWLDLVANPMQRPFVAGQGYPCGGGRLNISPAAAGANILGLTTGLINYLLSGTLPHNWPAAVIPSLHILELQECDLLTKIT